MFGPSARSLRLLCPRLTSAISSHRLSTILAQGKMTDLPGYCALTFPLMPAAYTPKLSVQVSDFEEICLLIQLWRLVCGFCSSGQRFACGFLRIPPRDGHPCRPANDSPCRVRRGLSPPSECALPGAQMKRPGLVVLVITQNFRDSRLLLFALEGRWILAGGETTGSRRPILRAPAGALDVNAFDEIVQDRATVPRPCRGAKAIMTGLPVVSPPANLRCASGAKLKRFG